MNFQNKNEDRRHRGPSEAKELPLKQILQSWFDDHDIAADFNEQEIINAWEECTGELIKKLTTKIYVKEKALFVHVNAPALRYELMMIRNDIRQKINTKLGKSTLRAIHIK